MNNAIYRKGHLQNAITVAPNQLDRTEIVFGPSSVVYPMLWEVLFTTIQKPQVCLLIRRLTQIFLIDFHQ